MINNLIVKVPSDVILDEMSDVYINALASISMCVATDDNMCRTKTVNNFKVINCAVHCDLQTVNYMISQFGLNWEVLGMQTWNASIVYKSLDRKFADYLIENVLPENLTNDHISKFSGYANWTIAP